MDKNNRDGENIINGDNEIDKGKSFWKTEKEGVVEIMGIMGRFPDYANKWLVVVERFVIRWWVSFICVWKTMVCYWLWRSIYV